MTEYRRAEAEDAEALAGMRWDMRIEDEEAPGMDRESFLARCADYYRRTIEDALQSHWVAVKAGGIVGTISVHLVQMLPRPNRIRDFFGCITNNYVRPEHRGQGIAGLLLNHVVEASRSEDLELLIVWPSEPAVPFYARAGFQYENEVMELRLRDYVPIRAPG